VPRALASIHRLTAASATVVALLVGVLTATQARVVGAFAFYDTNPLQLILVNYAIGCALLTLAVAVVPPIRERARRLLPLIRLRQIRWYQLAGGALGAWLVASQAITVPRLGVALSVITLVAGLIVAGVVVDAAGIGPSGKRPPTAGRIIAAVLALAAVVIDLAPQMTQQGPSLPIYHLIAFSAGCGVALQQALNGRVAAATGQPIVAGWVNFMIGAMVLGVFVVGLAAVGTTPLVAIPMQPWWLFTPGLLGASFVTLAAWAVRWIGVLRLGLLSVTGQLLAAFAFDLIAPMGSIAMEARIGISVLISLIAAVLASRGVDSRRDGPQSGTLKVA
jgi:transporter family-2 protein